jgi:anti-anti-sigma factor
MFNSGEAAEAASDGSWRWLRVLPVDYGRFQVVGEVDLGTAPLLCAALAGWDGDVELDCSDLTYIDVAGMRVLLAVDDDCRRRGATLSIANPSLPLRRLVELGGYPLALDECVQNATP